MIIHSPVISGSLTFADGATFTLPDNGIYSGSFSGSLQVHKVQSDLIPDVSGAYDLGSEAYPFQDLWLTGNTINIGGIGIGVGNALSGGPGLNIKNKSTNNPVEIAAKSITIGGLLGGVGTKSFKLNSNGNVELQDESGSIDTIEVKEIVLKDTSGNGRNTKIKNDGGKFTTQEVNNSGSVTSLDSEGSLSGSFTGSVLDLVATGNAVFNDSISVSGVSTFAAISSSDMDVSGHIIPSVHNTYDLGSTTKYWRDLYLSSGSLYINGVQVLSTTGTDFLVQTDAGENFKIQETGADTITLEAANGDITLTTTGTGNIELDAPIQIAAGKNILSSDGNAIAFANDVSLGSNKIYAANLQGVISSSAITYDGNNIDVAGNTTIQGNLTVQGTQVQLNTTTLNIEDKNLLIASGAADSAAANGAGITIDGADATFQWSSAGSRMVLSTPIQATKVFTDEIYDSSSTGLTIKSATDFEANNVTIGDGKLILNATAVSSTAAELNLVDGSSAGTVVNSKAVIYGAAGEVNATKLQIGGADITSSPAELNLLDGVAGLVQADFTKLAAIDASATEINQLDGVTVGGTTAGDIVTINGTQTLTNKTISAAQVTEISNLTAAEGAQLENIDTVTISNTQWGYLGVMNQNVRTTDNVTFANVNGATGTFTGDVIAYASSDERLKDNIEVISNPIEKVQQLKGVTWDWNDNADELQKSLPNVGVIAQDVEKVLPQLVKDRDNGFKGVDYDKIVGLLIEAIKDQQKQIDDLKSKI